MENKFTDGQIDMENRWAVYPIEKIEAAMARLNEAIVMARAAQQKADARKRQIRAEQIQREQEERAKQSQKNALAEAWEKISIELALNKLLCPGCFSNLPLEGTTHPTHIWADGCGMEPCLATSERKKQLREYFKRSLDNE